MIFDGKLVVQVDPGTVITDPESGRKFRVNDNQAVVQRNLLYVTPDRYRMLEEAQASRQAHRAG